MGGVVVLAFTAALNPSLLAATTLMLALPSPKRLLVGYLAGAAITSITCGLLLVFALPGSSTAQTTRRDVSPAVDLALGALTLMFVAVFASGAERRAARRERRRAKAEGKAPPMWKRTLSKGSARDTFLVGVLLSFPGASYVAGMTLLAKQDASDVATVLIVLLFNVIMLLLLEIPLLGFVLRPDATAAAIDRFSEWLNRRGARVIIVGGTVIGSLLILRGLLSL